MGAVSTDGGEDADPQARSPLGAGDQGRRAQPLSRARGCAGFEVAEVTDEGYRIRRMSDGSVLGDLFSRDDVRRERTRQGFWWH